MSWLREPWSKLLIHGLMAFSQDLKNTFYTSGMRRFDPGSCEGTQHCMNHVFPDLQKHPSFRKVP